MSPEDREAWIGHDLQHRPGFAAGYDEGFSDGYDAGHVDAHALATLSAAAKTSCSDTGLRLDEDDEAEDS